MLNTIGGSSGSAIYGCETLDIDYKNDEYLKTIKVWNNNSETDAKAVHMIKLVTSTGKFLEVGVT